MLMRAQTSREALAYAEKRVAELTAMMSWCVEYSGMPIQHEIDRWQQEAKRLKRKVRRKRAA